MRSIPSPELALWTDGEQSTRELRVRVKRPGDASWTNLSDTLGGDWVLGVRTQGDTPDQPAGQFTVSFLKHTTEGTLSPGISAGALNLDASSAFRPILHPGRSIEIDVRIDAEPWRLWLQGEIEDVEWAGSEVVATCLTPDGKLLATLIEDETTVRGADYPGVPVEDEIQDLADDWADDPPTLLVVGTPDFGVGKYTPTGFVGEQARTHAQRKGWDLRYKWSETDSDFRWTLYLPDRDKTLADFQLGIELMMEIPQLRVSRQWVRNRIVVRYNNTAGVEQTPVVVEDTTSIAEYGTRAMIIQELSPDSPIQDSTAATALATYAKGDLSKPLADGRYRIPFLPWLELHDLIAIQANADHYDYDTDFAVVGVSHVVEPEGGWWTEVELRGGKPAGSFYSWHSRTPAVPTPPEQKPAVTVVIAADQVSNSISATVTGNALVKSVRVGVGATQGAAQTALLASSTYYDGTVVTPGALGILDSGFSAGAVRYVAGQGFTGTGGTGIASELAFDRWIYGVGEDAIEDGAVTGDKVLDGIITTLKLAADAVTEAKIAAAAVTTTKIADDSISTPKIIAGAILAAKIAAGQIQTGHLVADAVTAAKLAAITIAVGKYIQSTNFATGVSGWKIDDSTAEFNDVIIRGTLDGATGTFSGNLDAATVELAYDVVVGTGTGSGSLFFGDNLPGNAFINNSGNDLNLECDELTLTMAKIGFFGGFPVAKPTGVAVTAAGIHAALVSLGLIAP